MKNLQTVQLSNSQREQQTSLTLSRILSRILSKYPLISQRENTIPSLYEAVTASHWDLYSIDKELNDKVTVQWIKGQLIDVLRFCGAFDDVEDFQIIVTAKQIRSDYYYLTLPELTFFFEKFIKGKFGKLYAGKKVNCQIFLQAISNFENEVINKRAKVQEEYEQQRKQREKETVRNGKTGIDGWREYCQTHGIKGQPLPMQDFLREMKKKSLMSKMLQQ